MGCHPPHPDSIAALRRAQKQVRQNGDDCLAMLLCGLEMYTAVGREWELLDIMRKFAHDSDDMVRNTPSAEELKKLYERDSPGRQSHEGRA